MWKDAVVAVVNDADAVTCAKARLPDVRVNDGDLSASPHTSRGRQVSAACSRLSRPRLVSLRPPAMFKVVAQRNARPCLRPLGVHLPHRLQPLPTPPCRRHLTIPPSAKYRINLPRRPFSSSPSARDKRYVRFNGEAKEDVQPDPGRPSGSGWRSWDVQTYLLIGGGVFVVGYYVNQYVLHLHRTRILRLTAAASNASRRRAACASWASRAGSNHTCVYPYSVPFHSTERDPAQMARQAHDELVAEFGERVLPADHPLTQHVHALVQAILDANGLGVLVTDKTAVKSGQKTNKSRAPAPKTAADNAPTGDETWDPDRTKNWSSTRDDGTGGMSSDAELPIAQGEWRLMVVDAPVPNAMATFGNVVVFTGILPIARNRNGLAAVLAHGAYSILSSPFDTINCS